MTVRPRSLPLAAALLAALTVGASRADAATFLGSLDTSATPDSVACAACPAGAAVGFRQFALRQSTVEAPEDGVLVSASATPPRIAGTEAPRIAILRPSDDDGVNLSVVASAPLPLSGGRVPGRRPAPADAARGLDRVPVQDRRGRARRARPAASRRCDPVLRRRCSSCGMDGGTGSELLFDAVLEPDVDGDTLGDETQDPDGGGLGLDWENDWFADYEEGDQLDDDFDEDFGDSPRSRRQVPRNLRLLQSARLAQRPSDAADQRPQGRAGERPGHAPGQPPHRRRPVHDDPDRRDARQARRAGPPAPERDPGGPTSPRASASACGRRSSSRTSRARRPSRC